MNAPVVRGFDIVFHIADEQGFTRLQTIFLEDFADFFAFVPNAGVGSFEESPETGHTALHCEMVGVHGAQEEEAEFAFAAEFQEGAGVWQFADGSLGTFELGVEPLFELRHGYVRGVAVVKASEGKEKLSAKLFERHFGFAGLRQNKIGRLEHGGQIVHERARPIENDIADHRSSLTLASRNQSIVFYRGRHTDERRL